MYLRKEISKMYHFHDKCITLLYRESGFIILMGFETNTCNWIILTSSIALISNLNLSIIVMKSWKITQRDISQLEKCPFGHTIKLDYLTFY